MSWSGEKPTERDTVRAPAVSDDDGDRTDQVRSPADSPTEGQAGSVAFDPSGPQLVSRVLVAWIELTVVGITGGLLGATVGGPPGFIIHLGTTLLTVGIIFYNVNELISDWLRAMTENT